MKKSKMKRIISGLLAFVMVALMIPFSTFVATAEASDTVKDIHKNPHLMLGFGYNAITGASMEIGNLITNSWIDQDRAKTYVFGSTDGTGVLDQYAKATFSKSSLEFLTSVGVDYTKLQVPAFRCGR